MTTINEPNVDGQDQQLATISANNVLVVDQQSSDMAMAGIDRAEKFVAAINLEFLGTDGSPGPEALAKQTYDRISALRKKFVNPANEWIRIHRERCKNWLISEQKRLDAERESALKSATEVAPWEEAPRIPVQIKATAGSGSLRNKPWSIESVDEDVLWKAAVENPKFRAYWQVDMKALTAKARDQKDLLNIPGVKAVQEKTLVKGK